MVETLHKVDRLLAQKFINSLPRVLLKLYESEP